MFLNCYKKHKKTFFTSMVSMMAEQKQIGILVSRANMSQTLQPTEITL